MNKIISEALDEVAPRGSGKKGNTKTSSPKRITASKRWCFTLNNYTEENVGSIISFMEKWSRYGCFGKENSEKGTIHLQGYVELKIKDRPFNKKYELSKKIHWEKSKGTKLENRHYCKKEEIWFFEYPKKYEVKIEKFYEWEEILLKTLKKAPDDRTIHWCWEPAGNRGKTVFQKYYYMNGKKRTIALSGKTGDMKNGVLTYLENTGFLPEVVFINIPKVKGNHCNIAAIEEIKDMFFYSGKYEGGMICGANPHVVIFANEEPPEGVLSEDRLNVIYIPFGKNQEKGTNCDEAICSCNICI